MQAYTLNFNDSYYRKKYFKFEVKNRVTILKSVSLLITMLFAPTIIISIIKEQYLISISLFLWIVFHWANIVIIHRIEIWLDYSQIVNLLIALCILFQFSHQGDLKQFESSTYGFALQTYSATLMMIGTNYFIDCLGQLLITFGFFLVLNIEISFSNCAILLMCFVMLCQVKYQIEKSKRLLFYFKEKEKKLGQSFRDTVPNPMLVICLKKKQNIFELFTQNEHFKSQFKQLKDNPSLTEFMDKFYIRQLQKQNQKDENQSGSQYSWNTQNQLISLNSYLQKYCQALQEKEQSTKNKKNMLLYLLNSQFGVIDCDQILKNNIMEFLGIIQSADCMVNSISKERKKYKLKIGINQSDQTHVIIFFEEINSTIPPSQIQEKLDITKAYEKTTEIIYQKIVKNLGHLIICTNSLIQQVPQDSQAKPKKILHRAVTGLNYFYNAHDYLNYQQGVLQIIPTQFSLQSLISDIQSVYKQILQDSKIQFNIECDNSINQNANFILTSDKRRIIQCMINLINFSLRSIHKKQNKNIYDNQNDSQENKEVQTNLQKFKQDQQKQEYILIIFSKTVKTNQGCIKISIKDSGEDNLTQRVQDSLKISSDLHSLNMQKISLFVTEQIVQKLGPEDQKIRTSNKKSQNKCSFLVNQNSLVIEQAKQIQKSKNQNLVSDINDYGFKLSSRNYESQSKIFLTTENNDTESPNHNQKMSDIIIVNKQINFARCSIQSDSAAYQIPNENLTPNLINSVLVPKTNFQNSFIISNSQNSPVGNKMAAKSIQFVNSPQILEDESRFNKSQTNHLVRYHKDCNQSYDKYGYEHNDSHLKFNDRDFSINQMSLITDYRYFHHQANNDNNITQLTTNIIQDALSKQGDSLNQKIISKQNSHLSKND
ncbi:hypothetical protein ABPG72_006876 [Tetrahymena utriculariae]